MTSEYKDFLKINSPVDKIMLQVTEYLKSQGIKFKKKENVIEYSTGTNFFSWGEKIIILFQDEIVSVRSKCKLPTQILDWGKNKKNVKNIINVISKS